MNKTLIVMLHAAGTKSNTRAAKREGTWGERDIKKLRAKLGLTQDDLAKKADIKYITLMEIEGGTVNKSSVQTTAKIAKALGVGVDDLLK